MLCDDLRLPYGTYGADVVREIRDQVQDHFQHFPPALREPETPAGNNDTDDGSKDASELRLLIKVFILIDTVFLGNWINAQ